MSKKPPTFFGHPLKRDHRRANEHWRLKIGRVTIEVGSGAKVSRALNWIARLMINGKTRRTIESQEGPACTVGFLAGELLGDLCETMDVIEGPNRRRRVVVLGDISANTPTQGAANAARLIRKCRELVEQGYAPLPVHYSSASFVPPGAAVLDCARAWIRTADLVVALKPGNGRIPKLLRDDVAEAKRVGIEVRWED